MLCFPSKEYKGTRQCICNSLNVGVKGLSALAHVFRRGFWAWPNIPFWKCVVLLVICILCKATLN